jgi:hypothetical protein
LAYHADELKNALNEMLPEDRINCVMYASVEGRLVGSESTKFSDLVRYSPGRKQEEAGSSIKEVAISGNTFCMSEF